MFDRTTWFALISVAAVACGKGGGAKKEAPRDAAEVVVAEPEEAVKVGTDGAKTMWAQAVPAFDGPMHVAADAEFRDVGVVMTGALRERAELFGETIEPVEVGALFGWKQATGATWVRVAETNVDVRGVMVGVSGVQIGGTVKGPWRWRKSQYAKAGTWEVGEPAAMLVKADGMPDQLAAPGGPADGSVIVGGKGIGFHGIVGRPALQRQRVISWDGGELSWSIDLARMTPPVQAFDVGVSGEDVVVCMWMGGSTIDVGDGKEPRKLFPPSVTGGTAAMWIGPDGAITAVQPLEVVAPADACAGFAATRAGVITVGPAGNGLDLVPRNGKRTSIARGAPLPQVIASDGGDRLLTVGRMGSDIETVALIVRELESGEELIRMIVPKAITVEDAAISDDLIAIGGRRRGALDLGQGVVMPAPKPPDERFVWALELPAFAR